MSSLIKSIGKATSIVLMSSLVSISVFAQDSLADETEQALNMNVSNQQINIDGIVKKESPGDKMAKARRQLEKKHEEMVHTKIEDMRLKEEQKIAKYLEKSLTDKMSLPSEKIKTSKTVKNKTPLPITKAVVTAHVEKHAIADNSINKFFVAFGGKQFSSNFIDDLESSSDISAGYQVAISNRFSVGFSLGYTTMKIKDVGGINYSFASYNPYGLNLSGLNIKYNNLALSSFVKFYMSDNEKIKPYISLDVAYNKTKLETEANSNYNSGYSSVNYNSMNNAVKSNNFSGGVHLGSDFHVSNSFSFGIDVSYTKPITQGFQTSSQLVSYPNDTYSVVLQKIGYNLAPSEILEAKLNIGFRF